MPGARSWLQLARAQTAPATVFCFLAPYLLAGGRDPTVALFFFVAGHLAHFSSFGHNSVMDYWHDLHDPNKRHHPLQSGAIKYEEAAKAVNWALALMTVATAAFVAAKSPSPLPLLLLVGYVAFGHAYNDGLDHATKHSWAPICLCFTCLSGVGYTMVREPDAALAALMAWAFVTMLYQIAWEGNLKDVWNPAEAHNPLRRCFSGGLFRCQLLSKAFFAARAVVGTALLAALAALVGAGATELVVLTILTVVEVGVMDSLHKLAERPSPSKEWRERLLEEFGKAEAVEFFRLLSLLGPAGGLLMLYGLAYFVAMNRWLWGSRFGPRV